MNEEMPPLVEKPEPVAKRLSKRSNLFGVDAAAWPPGRDLRANLA
jgi:hypothetical protein